MKKINGIQVTSKEFAYDGCHKIYLISNDKEKNLAVEYGYAILDVGLLKETFDNSCSLKFIDSLDLKVTYVKQFEKANFEGWK